MLVARIDTQEIPVIARDVTKEDGPFRCPECAGIVLVKKGHVKVHHFAHKPPFDCQYGQGESEEHRRAKMAIYDALRVHPDVTKAQLERSLPKGPVRPDVSCYIRGTPVAIEIQLSTLGLDEIDRRTRAYHSLGICVLWMPLYTDELEHQVQSILAELGGLRETDQEKRNRYSPAVWEKYLHTLYFGHVFYWSEHATVRPVHFADFEMHVEGGYDEDGNEHRGYFRSSKRYRTPEIGPPLSIIDFVPLQRKAWIEANITIPAAHLWTTKAKL